MTIGLADREDSPDWLGWVQKHWPSRSCVSLPDLRFGISLIDWFSRFNSQGEAFDAEHSPLVACWECMKRSFALLDPLCQIGHISPRKAQFVRWLYTRRPCQCQPVQFSFREAPQVSENAACVAPSQARPRCRMGSTWVPDGIYLRHFALKGESRRSLVSFSVRSRVATSRVHQAFDAARNRVLIGFSRARCLCLTNGMI